MTILSHEPCYSVALVQPFLSELSGCPGISRSFTEHLKQMPFDAKVPVRVVMRWLTIAYHITSDQDLGIKALRHVGRGTFDLIGFAASTCATWGDSLDLVFRYIRYLNEAAVFSVHTCSPSAVVEMCSSVPLVRAASDFQVGVIALAAKQWLGSLSDFELWFAHERPENISSYRESFAPAALRFGAPHDGITFPQAFLAAPLRHADPELNALLTRERDLVVAPRREGYSPSRRHALRH